MNFKKLITSIKIRFLKILNKNRGYFNIGDTKMFLDFLDPIDREIIVNQIYEVEEIEYLKILNPRISQLEKKRVSKLAENSLINEFVKKSELEKTFDLNADGKFKDNPFSEEYFVNLYTKLNFSSEENFRRELNKVNNYSLDEIKEKLKIEILWNELI